MYTQMFEQKTLDYLQKHQMLCEGDTVTVAFSGGADSGALLFCMLRLAQQLHIQVQAVHINHRLRQQESEQEEAYVRQICKQNDVPLTVFYARDWEEPIPETGQEMWARERRYRFFEQIQSDTNKVATAHTATDQAETLLFRLARGTGVKGAAAIAPVRSGYIRPLLWAERDEIEEYCRQIGYRYVVDSSNLSLKYTRNKIRHQILPLLREINPKAVEQMAAYCEEMRSTQEYLQAKAETLLQKAKTPYGWNVQMLLDADAVIADMALAKICSQKAESTRQRIAAIRQVCTIWNSSLPLAKGWRLRNYRGTLLWEEVHPQTRDTEIPLAEGVFYEDEDFCLEISCKSCETNKIFPEIQKKDLNYWADCAKIPNDTVLRSIRPGDWFSPRGRGVSKPLRKFYAEQQVPAALRGRLPVLASGNKVLWVWGYGFADGLFAKQASCYLYVYPHGCCEKENEQDEN